MLQKGIVVVTPPQTETNEPGVMLQHLRLQRLVSEEEIRDMLQLFEDIAVSEGWQHGGELHVRLTGSTYFGLRISEKAIGSREDCPDIGEALAGGLQLVGPDDKGRLPCQKLWPEIAAENTAKIAYVAVLAVRKEWRGKRGDIGAACFWMLTGALWRHCMENGITDLWLEATPTMLRCYRLLGWTLQVRGPLRTHWGEDCYPCSLSLRETAGALVEKALRSRTYRRIIETALDTGSNENETGVLYGKLDLLNGTVT